MELNQQNQVDGGTFFCQWPLRSWTRLGMALGNKRCVPTALALFLSLTTLTGMLDFFPVPRCDLWVPP